MTWNVAQLQHSVAQLVAITVLSPQTLCSSEGDNR